MAANVQQLEETLRQPLPVPERKEETHGPSPPVAEGKRRVPQGGGEEPAVPPVPAAPATLPTQIVQLIEDVRVVVEEASHIGSTAMTPNQKRQRKHAAQLLASVLDTLPDQIAFRRACEAKLPLLLEAIVTLDNSLVVARIFMKRIWAATKRPAPRRRVEDPPSTEMDEEEEARKRDEDEEDEQQELVDVFSRQYGPTAYGTRSLCYADGQATSALARERGKLGRIPLTKFSSSKPDTHWFSTGRVSPKTGKEGTWTMTPSIF